MVVLMYGRPELRGSVQTVHPLRELDLRLLAVTFPSTSSLEGGATALVIN